MTDKQLIKLWETEGVEAQQGSKVTEGESRILENNRAE